MDVHSQPAGEDPKRGPEVPLELSVKNFVHNLGDLLSVGLPLLKALHVLHRSESNGRLKEAIKQVHDRVEAGATISDALSEHPKVFDRLLVNMVTAGETGGVLDIALQRTSKLIEVLDEMKHDATLDTSSTPMLHPETREYSAILGTLVNGGVPILESVVCAAQGLSDDFKKVSKDLHDTIREGGSMVEALKRHTDFIDPITLQYIDVGEETGELDRTLWVNANRKA